MVIPAGKGEAKQWKVNSRQQKIGRSLSFI